jgi:hypothetical protein
MLIVLLAMDVLNSPYESGKVTAFKQPGPNLLTENRCLKKIMFLTDATLPKIEPVAVHLVWRAY